MTTMQQEEFLKWEERFELGIPAIDEQHKSLVEIYNHLHGEVMETRIRGGSMWREALSDSLRDAVNHAKTHFALEEKLMAAAGYESLDIHKERHHDFVEKVTELLSSFNKCDLHDALEFSRFIHEWITMHIAREDKLYAKKVRNYLNANHMEEVVK